MTKDDPPALLVYSYSNEEVKNEIPLDFVVHHPKFGIALKARMEALHIPCVVQDCDGEAGHAVRRGERNVPVNSVQFIRGHTEKALSAEKP